jgi:arsenate reductase-like glutaredoxin family protein
MTAGDGNLFLDATYVTEKGQKVIRFETLLWGGDEMLFVMPAWHGFEFIHYFFDKTANWETPEGRQLTHAAGIVFCHVKSPIRIIRRIAQSIADTVKNKLGEQREKNFWDYMVLESIDYPTTDDIEHFKELRYEKRAVNRTPYLTPQLDWRQMKEQFRELIVNETISKRQLYRILDVMETNLQQSSETWQELSEIERTLPKKASAQAIAERRMLQLIEADDRLVVADLFARLGRELFKIDMDRPNERIWLWLHFIELWDYMFPQKQEGGT